MMRYNRYNIFHTFKILIMFVYNIRKSFGERNFFIKENDYNFYLYMQSLVSNHYDRILLVIVIVSFPTYFIVIHYILNKTPRSTIFQKQNSIIKICSIVFYRRFHYLSDGSSKSVEELE